MKPVANFQFEPGYLHRYQLGYHLSPTKNDTKKPIIIFCWNLNWIYLKAAQGAGDVQILYVIYDKNDLI